MAIKNSSLRIFFLSKGALMIRIFLLLPLFYLFSHESITAVTENDPATLVDGVSVITGDFYAAEEDYIIAGAEPISICRSYLSAVGGINQYPHLTATFILVMDKLLIDEPNGTQVVYAADSSNEGRGDIGKEFYHKKKSLLRYHSVDFAKTAPGLTNTSTGNLSAKTQLKNQTIIFDPNYDNKGKSFTLHAADGTVRRYTHYLNQEKPENGPCGKFYIAYYYKLISETLPNGRVLHYEWDSKNCLVGMRTSNPHDTKTFVKVPFPEVDLRRVSSYSLQGSDGRSVSYTYRSAGKNRIELAQVVSPEQANQCFSYSSDLLSHILLPRGRTLEIQYEGGKVSQLLSPIGPNGSMVPCYRFFYKTQMSECFDALENKTEYFWNGDYRLTLIRRFDHKAGFKNSETFVWEDTNLKAKVFYDEHNTPLFAKTFSYDPQGNVLQEILWGDLSGRGLPLHIGSNGLPIDDGVEKSITQNTYEDRNLLKKCVEPSGLITEITYRPDAQLPVTKTLSDASGVLSQTTYTYDNDLTLTKEEILSGTSVHRTRKIIPRQEEPYIALPEWIIEEYQGKLLLKTKFHYTTGALVSQKDVYDADGVCRYSLQYKYDPKGRMREETNALGQRAFYEYDDVGNKIYTKDFSGRLETFFTYDLANRLIEKKERGFDGIEQVCRYSYDFKHNLITETDPYGNTTQHDYDFEGRRIKTIYPPQRVLYGECLQPITETTYNALGAIRAQTDALGNKTETESNILGKPTQITYSDGAVEQNFYTLDGKLSLHIDPLGAKTHYRYNALGYLIEKRTEDAVETYVYDGSVLIRKTDAAGHVTTYTYDKAGRKTSETIGKETIRYTYDALGNVRSKIEGDCITFYQYDLMGRVREEKQADALGDVFQITEYDYDAAGNQAIVIQGLKSKECLEYDSLNRLKKKTDPLEAVTTIEYTTVVNDLRQNVLQKTTTDPLGLRTIETFDARGRVFLLEKKNNRMLFTEDLYYNANGQKTAQELGIYNPDGTFRSILNQWEYDTRQRLKTLIEGNGAKVTRYEYDLNGRKKLEVKPDGTRLFFDYNPLGHLIRLHSSDRTVDHKVVPDPLGRLTSFDGIARTLDPHGRILTETWGDSLCIENRYDKQGRREYFSLPHFDIQVDYDFAPLHLSRVRFKNWAHEYSKYDLAGNVLTEILIDGATLNRTYDEAYRPRSIQTNRLTQYIPRYDLVGNILAMEIDGCNNTYTYDELYQLTSEQGQFHHSYGFDSLYNRLSKDHESYFLNALNQIRSHCLYDLNGNPIQVGGLRLTYDALGRLIHVENAETAVDYTYDYLNRCLTRTEAGKTLHFLYDGQNEIGSYDEKLRDFRVFGNIETAEMGAAVMVLLDGRMYVPIHDLQGNLATLGMEAKYRYGAFGEESIDGTLLSPWRFSSKRIDPTTGFANYGRRYYMPTLGRWLTPDPLGFTAGSNFYAFVQNAPLTHLDEYGLFTVPISYKPWQEPPEALQRFGIAAAHEIGKQTLDAGRFIASTPYHIERGFNYVSGRDAYTFSAWNDKQSRFFNKAEDWMYRALPTDRNHPDYLMYRRGIGSGIELGTCFVGGYGLAKGGLKAATIGAQAWRLKKGTFVAGEKLTKSISPVSREIEGIINIKGFTQHGVDRAVFRGVSPQAILDTLKNPLKINEIKVDHLGRPSQRLIGKSAEIVLNPQTQKILSVNPTSKRKFAKLTKEIEK